MAHYAHYVKRIIAVPDYQDPNDPYYAEHQVEDDGFLRPKFHAHPGHAGLAKAVRPGDCIWLFSQLSGPWGKLPPSLDAQIHVSKVRTTEHGLHFYASKQSQWFPLFDATDFLSESSILEAREKNVACLNEEHTHIGQSLRFLRRIGQPNLLEAFAKNVLQSSLSFISYRLIDGTEAAFHIVRSELSIGRAVFWDRWSLPRRLAERREFVASRALDRRVFNAIDSAERVIGVCTPLYAREGSYSHSEWSRALRQRKFVARSASPVDYML